MIPYIDMEKKKLSKSYKEVKQNGNKMQKL